MIVINPKKKAKRTKYKAQKNGATFELQGEQRIACCDCGLIHRFEFRVVNGKIIARAWRDNRATAARRRNQGITLA